MDWLQEEEMKMQKGRTKFITESDEGLIAIENLPADICIQCGAEYIPADVDDYIALEMRQTILVPLSSLYTLHSSGFQGQ